MDGLFWFLFGGVILALATFWVYRDAKSRGDSGAIGWGLFTFFFLIIGLPLYLWSRKPRPKSTQPELGKTCPSRGHYKKI